MSDAERLISVAEAAQKLGATRARINQFITEDRLPAQKVGRSFVIKEGRFKPFAAQAGRQTAKTKIVRRIENLIGNFLYSFQTAIQRTSQVKVRKVYPQF